MNTQKLFDLLDRALPDDRIAADFAKIIDEIEDTDDSHTICFEFDEEEKIVVPRSVDMEIITKAACKKYFGFTFGAYQVEIAVGGIEKQEKNEINPKYFFMTLHYNEDCQLITSDIHTEMR